MQCEHLALHANAYVVITKPCYASPCLASINLKHLHWHCSYLSSQSSLYRHGPSFTLIPSANRGIFAVYEQCGLSFMYHPYPKQKLCIPLCILPSISSLSCHVAVRLIRQAHTCTMLSHEGEGGAGGGFAQACHHHLALL